MRLKPRVRLESTASSLFSLGVVQLVTLAVLFFSLVHRQPDVILVSALILVVVGVARVWCRLSLRGVTFQTAVSRNRLYPDEELILSVRAENRKLLPVWVRGEVPADNSPSAGSTDGGDGSFARDSTTTASGFAVLAGPPDDLNARRGPAQGAGQEEVAPFLEGETGLLAFQQVAWTRTLKAVRRGAYLLGPVRTDAGDLLGFFRRREERPVRIEVLVYPRLVPVGFLGLPIHEFFGLQKAWTPVEDPVSQIGTRDYRGNRPARHIHWKTSARLNKLQEKLYEPTAQAKAMILLDAAGFSVTRPPSMEGYDESFERERQTATRSFERTIEVAASLAVELDRHRIPVGLAVNGILRGGASPLLLPARGPYQIADILEMLARLTSRSDQAGGGVIGAISQMSETTTRVYVCRGLTGRAVRMLRELQYRRRAPVVALVAELESLSREAAIAPAGRGLSGASGAGSSPAGMGFGNEVDGRVRIVGIDELQAPGNGPDVRAS